MACLLHASGLGKCYRIYGSPADRLKQAIWRDKKKYYKDFWALQDVSFSVAQGEALGIIGRNGSGKSTLLQLLCGTLTPSQGEVQVHGRLAALLELGSGFNPEFTGLENVFLNAALLGLSRQQTSERLDDILAFADIGDFVHQPVKTYSSGMQLRLAFAVITQAEADLLVIDEALAVGDAVFTQRCMRFIQHCRETRGLLFVSHDAGSVATLTDRCLWLKEGQLHRLGETPEILPHYVNYCQRLSGAQQDPSDGSDEGDEAPLLELNRAPAAVDRSKEAQALAHPSVDAAAPVDFRQELIRHELLAMHYSLSEFTTGGDSSHRDGSGDIETVLFENDQGEATAYLTGGAVCRLRVIARLHRPMRSPMIGFAVVNRLGQTLFGENTYGNGLYADLEVPAGELIEATFVMQWPWLAQGSYSVTVAMASGGRLDHVNHCWLNDSVLITSTPGTKLVNGLFAPAMLAIDLKRQADGPPVPPQ